MLTTRPLNVVAGDVRAGLVSVRGVGLAGALTCRVLVSGAEHDAHNNVARNDEYNLCNLWVQLIVIVRVA